MFLVLILILIYSSLGNVLRDSSSFELFFLVFIPRFNFVHNLVLIVTIANKISWNWIIFCFKNLCSTTCIFSFLNIFICSYISLMLGYPLNHYLLLNLQFFDDWFYFWNCFFWFRNTNSSCNYLLLINCIYFIFLSCIINPKVNQSL